MAKRWALAAAMAMVAAAACDDGGDGDADADVEVPACPDEPPASGSACETVGQHCTWERCAAAEPTVYVTWCMSAGWSVSTRDCLSISCEGESCLPGELCLARSGGALLTECVANPCGDAAVEASCACDFCAGYPCTIEELTITCNTCASGQCP